MSALGAIAAPSLGAAEYDAIRKLLHRACGIRLNGSKEELVRSRLLRRLRELRMGSFHDYLRRVEHDPRERTQLIDALTTNTTHFFRERHHFELLTNTLLPQWKARRCPVRIWSAGCSSGQEPYSLAMTIRDYGELRDARILATDISTRVLRLAAAGEYTAEELGAMTSAQVDRHFVRTTDGGGVVVPATRALVKFAKLNLLERWPMKGPFQAIFCRNVMIYFQRELQTALAKRYIDLIEPGGVLCIGHSESLPQGVFPVKLIAPATYQKVG